MAKLELIGEPLTQDAFFPFGDVLEARGEPTMIINDNRCDRFHDLARISYGSGRAGISIFKSGACALPYELKLMERHPLGSQAFIPMLGAPYLIVVAPDENGKPGQPLAFLASPGQGVNYLKNTWHAPLIALEDDAMFTVIDRIGVGHNLEEYVLETPCFISA